MGIADITSRVITKYIADTSDQQREIDKLIDKNRQLQSAEKAAAKGREQHFDQLILGLTRSNKGADESALSWDGYGKKVDAAKGFQEGFANTAAKAGAVIGTVIVAVNLASDALKSYGENLRLEAATGGINIDQLSKSFGGLVNQHDLMTFAAQTNTGALKLNQQQMETVGQAALALKNRGFDLEESVKKLTDAAVKGKVNGLDDLGLSIKEGSSKAETLKNMMTELNKVINESGTATNNDADAIQRLSVQWDNATQKAKNYAAQALIASGQALDLEANQRLFWERLNGFEDLRKGIDRGRAIVGQQQQQQAFLGGIASGRKQVSDLGLIEMDDMDLSGERDKRKSDALARAQKLAEERRKLANEWTKKVTDELVKNLEDGIRGTSGYGITAQDYAKQQGIGLGTSTDGYQARKAGAEDALGVQVNPRSGESLDDSIERASKTSKALTTVFGPEAIKHLSLYDEGLAKLGDTFNSLSDAVGASYEAMVTGQGSISKAFKTALADGLMATGKQSSIDALRETALGFASLALGPIGGASAAAHFTAAGLHAAVAVAAGVAAHEIGTSAQSNAASKTAPATGGSAGSGSSGGGGSGNVTKAGQEKIIYVLGDPFYEMSPRERARSIDKAIQRTTGGAAGSDS